LSQNVTPKYVTITKRTYSNNQAALITKTNAETIKIKQEVTTAQEETTN
jgi:hypothetical protein